MITPGPVGASVAEDVEVSPPIMKIEIHLILNIIIMQEVIEIKCLK